MLDYVENIKADRDAYDLLFGHLLATGLPINLSCTSEQVDGFEVLSYGGGTILACFDKNLPFDLIRELASRKPEKIFFRDASFKNSADKINALEYFRCFAEDTEVKVL